jgi:hypothetical protein
MSRGGGTPHSANHKSKFLMKERGIYYGKQDYLQGTLHSTS